MKTKGKNMKKELKKEIIIREKLNEVKKSKQNQFIEYLLHEINS